MEYVVEGVHSAVRCLLPLRQHPIWESNPVSSTGSIESSQITGLGTGQLYKNHFRIISLLLAIPNAILPGVDLQQVSIFGVLLIAGLPCIVGR